MMTRSLRRPRLTAASVPSARPLGTAISIAPSISSTVGPMVIASSSLTILLEMIERPRSPRSTRMMYSKNWIGIDRSSPSSRRMAAMVSALASGPAMIIAGSAGTTCNRQKQRKRTPSKAGNEISRRWTICCPMRRQRTGWAKRKAPTLTLLFPSLGSRASSDVRSFCLSSDSDTCLSRRHAQTADRVRLRPFARHADNHVSPMREFRVAGTYVSRSPVVCQRSLPGAVAAHHNLRISWCHQCPCFCGDLGCVCHDYEQWFLWFRGRCLAIIGKSIIG